MLLAGENERVRKLLKRKGRKSVDIGEWRVASEELEKKKAEPRKDRRLRRVLRHLEARLAGRGKRGKLVAT